MDVVGGSLLVLLTVITISASVTCEDGNGRWAVLQLERRRLDGEAMLGHDRRRHSTLFRRASANRLFDFSLNGSADPMLNGLYYTKVKLGSPPVELNVHVDTGSDVFWVACSTCTNCPTTLSGNRYGPSTSKTSRPVNCKDEMCKQDGANSVGCSADGNNSCSFAIKYGDESSTSGNLVSDALHLDMLSRHSRGSNSSTTVVFGCSDNVQMDYFNMDGVLGFGPGDLSIVTQLHHQRIAPGIFSHCFKSGPEGGGTLFLGELVGPNMSYTPLVGSRASYHVYMESIAVNGLVLPIDPHVLAPSHKRELKFDSGTTLAYLVDEALDPLLNSISRVVADLAVPLAFKDMQCYHVSGSSSESEIFPTITLNFVGSVSLTVKPQDYLFLRGPDTGGELVYCIAFVSAKPGSMILGDVVMKDKIFVYDLDLERIGWAPYNCPTTFNASSISTSDRNGFRKNGCGSPQIHQLLWIFAIALCLIPLYVWGN